MIYLESIEKYRVEDVFKTEGIPTFTFVEPLNYGQVLVDFRNTTKPVIIEGPSGSGKTVTAKKLMMDFYSDQKALELSGRLPENHAKLEDALRSEDESNSVILLDDFHRFPKDLQSKVGDKIKLISEGAIKAKKYIIIGIPEVGKGLIQLTPDLLKRIGIHRIEPADLKKTIELIEKGSQKLNLAISPAEDIYNESQGDYWLIQRLLQTLCVINGIFETQETKKNLVVNIESCRKSVITLISNGYDPAVVEFSRGRRFRPGNTTYFKLLQAIAHSGRKTVNLDKLSADMPEIKSSVDQLKTGRLATLIQDKTEVRRYFYYDTDLRIFSIEDPAMRYYLKHVEWSKIEEACGFKLTTKDYDVAVSFAGSSRELVKNVVEQLKSSDVSVFYDEDYESKFLGSSMEDTFRKIYATDAKLILAFIDKQYDERLWPKFEKSCFEIRVKKNEVVPIFLDDTKVKGIPDDIWGIKPQSDPASQPKEIAEKVFSRLQELERDSKPEQQAPN